MHRLLPPFILDRYAAGEASGQFEAAALFVDMSGFSAMTSALMAHGQHGAEVLAQVMRAIFDPLVEAIYAQGGFISTFAGDAFTAVFPFVGAQGLAPLRALAAAWAIRGHMAAHPVHTTPYGVFAVAAKIGMAVGEAAWGIIQAHDGSQATFFFRGSAIDDSASAEHHAQSGDLILHASALRELGNTVAGEEIDGGMRVTNLEIALPDPQPVSLIPPHLDIQARFFPRSVIEQTQIGEFRRVVNVFINLYGEPSDADLVSVVHAVFDLQSQYGGYLNHLDFGDKGCSLLLFWGAPVSHENDVLRALNFSLELRDAVHIPLRIGITSHIAHAGFIGSSLHEEYTCYSKGVNLAARLMTAAPWGSIWMDEEVQHRAAARCRAEAMGAMRFKGFAEPLAVYSLLGWRSEIDSGYERAMVGRQAERQALTNFVKPIQRGRYAGVMVVQGEAGMGKSRLVQDFRASDFSFGGEPGPDSHPPIQNPQSKIQNPQWFNAQTDSILRQPLNPFRYWLRVYFGYNPLAPEAENKRAFDARLDALIVDLPDAALRDELMRVRSVLGALVDLHWDGSLYARLDPPGRYENTLIAIKTLLLAESLHQPTLLLIEDIHWLDPDSVQVIRRLVRDIDAYPLAILATARPDPDPLFGGEIDYEIIQLTALTRPEMTTLATGLLGAPPTPALLDLLIARTDGNPFFVEQLLLYLRDEGQLVQIGDSWSVNQAALDTAPLPTDVSVIFVARLDRLGQKVKEVVQTASVLGREFEVTVLSEMLQHEDVRPTITSAETDGIWNALSEIRYLFRHVLLRDAAYEMQIQTQRARLHQLAARSLEAVFADHLRPHYGEISHHFEAAYRFGVTEVRPQAVDYLTQAGDHATDTFANTAAADYFTRALALTPVEDTAGRFQLLLARENIYDFLGNREGQAEDIAALEALALQRGQPAEQAEAAMRRAYLAGGTADIAGELLAANEVLRLARVTDIPALESTAYRIAGASLRIEGKLDEALDHFQKAIEVAHAAELPYQEATGWTAWSSLNVQRGNWAAATPVLERIIPVFEQLGRLFRVAMALNELGLALMVGGRPAEAQVRFEEALALTREIGDRPGQIPPLNHLALVLIAQGEYRRAASLADQAIAISREVQDRYLEMRGWMAKGRAAMHSGDLDTARGFLDEALHWAQSDFPTLRGWILAHHAALALLAGSPAAAHPLAAQAVDLARAVNERSELALALVYLGLAQEALGELEAAASSFRECLDLELQMGAAIGRGWDGRAGLARIYLAQGRWDEALAAAEPIAAHIETTAESGERGHGLGQCEQPLRVYLSCYRVLSAAGDARAAGILARSAAVLMTVAEQFEEPASRHGFLNEIPYHAEILMTLRSMPTGEDR